MIEATIKKTGPVTAAFVDVRGPYEQIPHAMGDLYAWIGAHGLEPTGMPHAVYFTAPGETPPDQAAWEVYAELAGAPAPEGPDEAGHGVRRIEGATFASAMHRGPYETIGSTYEELGAWVTEHGYHLAGPPEELYLSDPAVVAPQDYLTEIRFPIATA